MNILPIIASLLHARASLSTLRSIYRAGNHRHLLGKAEEGMRKHIEKGRRLDNIYAFYIREIPVDRPAVGTECLSERAYWPGKS